MKKTLFLASLVLVFIIFISSISFGFQDWIAEEVDFLEEGLRESPITIGCLIPGYLQHDFQVLVFLGVLFALAVFHNHLQPFIKFTSLKE